jgi:predicted transcriptional regulator
MTDLNINLNDHKTLTAWMRSESKKMLSKRYKQTHMAEDMGVSDAMMSRFMRGHPVNEKFINKWFDFFVSSSCGVLE